MVSDSNSRQNKKVSLFIYFLLMCIYRCCVTPVTTGTPSYRLRRITLSLLKSEIIMYCLLLLEMFPWILLCSQTTFSLLPIGKSKNLIATNLIKRLNRQPNKRPPVNLTRIYPNLKRVWVTHRNIIIDQYK